MTPEAFSKRLAMGGSSVGPAWGSEFVSYEQFRARLPHRFDPGETI